jgi:hypothetical protein
MHQTHRLGNADLTTGYYSYYQSLLPIVSKDISNAFWTTSDSPIKAKCNIMKYRTGTLFNQIHAIRFKLLTNPLCPLCQQTDSALHILSNCQHSVISKMITNCHSIACRIILKAISKDTLGACFVCMDAGSADCLALQNLQSPKMLLTESYQNGSFPLVFPTKTDSPPAVLMLS